MSATPFGNHAAVSIHGPNNFTDVAGNQYNYYNYSASADSHREATQHVLKKLDPVDMDATHRDECLPGTRSTIIQLIMDWVTEPGRKHGIIWVRGLAGSGKSTLATTIMNRLSAIERLGAFLFFERDVSVRSDPSKVIKTLAYKLGVSHPTVGEAIAANVMKYPEITHYPLRSQFEHLLAQPIISCSTSNAAPPAVFVLDALDECGDPDERETLLELLAEQASILPALFVITSRPSQDICGFFQDRDYILIKELDISTQNNYDDISTFLMLNLKRIRTKHPSLRRRSHWPGNEELEKLESRASGLFIWASTACKFIDKHPPDRRLEQIIRGSSATVAEAEHSLDALYRTALESAGSWDIPDFVTDFRAALGFILVARRPLPGNDIVSLLGSSVTECCIDVISQLGCVLQSEPTVRLLHPSFADFLFNPKRCINPQWLFEDSALHHSVALLCIEHMNVVLKQNLFSLTLSPDLPDVKISDDIAYACMYWGEHICIACNSSDIIPLLEDFLQRHLLHWVEAMSVLCGAKATIGILERVSAWLTVQNMLPNDLLSLVNDAIRFVRRNADLIEQHPLLVYSSALPLTPPQSLLYRRFHDPVRHFVSLGLIEKSWSPLLQVLSGHLDNPASQHWTPWVHSVAYSPDGTRIVSGSDDKTARVWDSSSGIPVLPPLAGHEGDVLSVTFSPDSTRIASGHRNNSVRLWDASSGMEVLAPMLGHAAGVNSVVFSPDGKYIISASEDTTIRIWDAKTGAEVRPPLNGHTLGIRSVSCSPDGKHIASGSKDNAVRVWDIASGLNVLPHLQGHTDGVWSVAYSPDGRCIASGSLDHTVRIWDATTGYQMLPPFEGHTNWVRAVAFSPKGTRIVSSSDDKTIRVWDVTAGTEVSPPFIYTHGLISVAFSPDGTQIISGSINGALQVWDATSDIRSIPQPEGHHLGVNSVAFSPDGNLIVSGSEDKTVRIWDSATCVQLLPPLRGHFAWVTSVAFSPDGVHVASGSADGTIRAWDARTGLEVLPPLVHSQKVTSVAYSIDGHYIISHDGSGQGYLWNAQSGTLISDASHISPLTVKGEIDLHDGGWVMDRLTKKYLSKLPSNILPRCHASHRRCLAVGDYHGKVFITDFPAA